MLAGGGSSDRTIGGRGNDILSGNQTDAVVYDNRLDTFLFFGKFGHDTITDFHIGFSTSAFVGGIDESDVTAKTEADDVKISLAHLGKQSILVKGVADEVDPSIDILLRLSAPAVSFSYPAACRSRRYAPRSAAQRRSE